jgi:ketosteroid isomerase-like protein
MIPPRPGPIKTQAQRQSQNGGIAVLPTREGTAMSLEQNKQTVLAFIATMTAGDPDASLVCEDAIWWVPGREPMDHRVFFDIVRQVDGLFEAAPVMQISAVTAEDDRVAVEASVNARLKDGRIYANTYHFLFRLRDGRISEGREHNNSVVPATLFGNSLAPA